MAYLHRFRPDVFTPLGMSKMFAEMGFEKLHDCQWWTKMVSNHIELTCVPARHWSCRDGNTDANFFLWSGWILKASGITLYFAGDTAYDETIFTQILQACGPIDVLLIPIAPEGEENIHVNLEKALLATRFIAPKLMIPIHWGTLRTDAATIESPRDRLLQLLDGPYSDLKHRVEILKIGKIFPLEKQLRKKEI